MSRHKFKGEVTLEGVSASTGNALVVTNSTPVTQLTVANQGRVTLSQDLSAPTQTNGTAVISVGTNNASLVLAPNGTGAIMASIPDGGAGGNVRGNYAVDLQTVRNANTQVASGSNSVILGGAFNTASNIYCIAGGYSSIASASGAIALGGSTNIAGPSVSGLYAVGIGGGFNVIGAAASSVIGGYAGRTYLQSQQACSSGGFVAPSDGQRSTINLIRSINGTAQTELTLDGSAPAASSRAILNRASPGPTNARAWRAQIDVIAIVQTAGAGGLVLGETFIGSYFLGIKNIGGTTSLIGSGVTTAFEEWDTNMATAAVVITADDTNDCLKVEFKPSNLADGNTVTRVVATAYLTEVGY